MLLPDTLHRPRDTQARAPPDSPRASMLPGGLRHRRTQRRERAAPHARCKRSRRSAGAGRRARPPTRRAPRAPRPRRDTAVSRTATSCGAHGGAMVPYLPEWRLTASGATRQHPESIEGRCATRSIARDRPWRKLRLPLFIPSGGFGVPARRQRVLALIAVRNQLSHLRGCIESLRSQVDGIVALDDGSTDGSLEFLESCAEVLELIRISCRRPHWDEIGNHRRLVAAGLRHGADWLLSIDADERVELQFRARAERVIRRGNAFGLTAYALQLREIWDDPLCYRADGIWGRKRVARLFRALPDHRFDTRPLHGVKAPLQARIGDR